MALSGLRKPVPTLFVYDRYWELKVAKSCVMSAIAIERLLTLNEPYAQWCWASYDQLICYTITRCCGKREAVFAIAIAAGDSINYQSIVYGRFVWENRVRYWITVIYLGVVLGVWVNFPDPDVLIKYTYASKGITVFKISFGKVFRQIYGRKLSLMATCERSRKTWFLNISDVMSLNIYKRCFMFIWTNLRMPLLIYFSLY